MAQIIAQGENGVQAIVQPAVPAQIIVSGALRGEQGLQGNPGATGATGPAGPPGGTGGIVPITVSTVAPSAPNVNDLWIDIS